MVATEKRKLRFVTGSAQLGAHEALWAEPYPLWEGVPSRLGGPHDGERRPSLVCYRGDDFMDRLRLDLLSPAQLAAARATGTPQKPKKFFLPFHGDFALAAASLVCVVPGHPDRAVDAAKKESIWFVIRRVRKNAAGVMVEEAWAKNRTPGWVYAGTTDKPLPVDDEERLGLVRIPSMNGRHVWVAYIPLASTDTYALRDDDPMSTVAEVDLKWKPIEQELARIQDIDGRGEGRLLLQLVDKLITDYMPVADQIRNGHPVPGASVTHPRQHALGNWLLDASNFDPLTGTWQQALEQARGGALPQDLTRVSAAKVGDSGGSGLARLLDRVGDEIIGGFFPHPVITPKVNEFRARMGAMRRNRRKQSVAWLHRLIGDAAAGTTSTGDLAESNIGFIGAYLPDVAMALRSAGKPGVTNPTVGEKAPGKQFWDLLVTIAVPPSLTLDAALVEASGVAANGGEDRADLDITGVDRAKITALGNTVKKAVSGAVVPKYPVSAVDQDVYFVIRYVLEHACRLPERQLFSDASDPWYPAGIFDPEAPARDIRVPMPMDLDPKALAKPMGLGFMMGKQLRKQMARIGPKMLAGEAGPAPNIDLGAICTFSIPIVTICALILLLIMVNILNVIFRWLPYFVVCYPLKLAKK